MVTRLAIILLSINLVTIGIAHFIGLRSKTLITIGIHENEGEPFMMYVHDISYHFEMWLAGKRCFKPLPPWVYPKNNEPVSVAPDIGHSFAKGYQDSAEVVIALRCP